MILVTGATGTVGTEVVEQLAAGGHRVRALVRNPAKTDKIRGSNVEVVLGDMSQTDTLRAPLEGVDRVFLLTGGPGADLLELEGNVLEQAQEAGVNHIVKMSGNGVDFDDFPYGQRHRESEKKIEGSGIAWTHLRPCPFMTNTLFLADSIKSAGAIYLPAGDGKVPVIDPRDIAAVAVKVLTEKGHEGNAYELTGSEPLSYAEMAEQLSTALGRQVGFVDVPEPAAREGMLGAGMSPAEVNILLDVYGFIKAGRFGAVSPDFERLMGRRTRTFAAWAIEHAAAFR